ncbi:MAG: hypothetical protein M3348_06530 [Acidobacteriota bacterium]|nr:hypothetical protein [Acidobacteriota bacterium]
MHKATPQPPSQEEFESQLRDLFRNGDITSVAAWLGKNKSQISRQLNPEEPEQSDPFRFALFLDACYRTRHELGAGLWALLEVVNKRHQAKGAETTAGALGQMYDAMKVLHDPNATEAAKTQAANKAIEVLESFKYGLCLQTGEGHPAAKAGR